ncbi:unnamed protein product [Adineta ricciae]|uniref:Uncharacterized protein n=1 Tax=Adineta ricciae TaxID=249248 RepID=A0A815X2D8_ADIRI|nr:unnamed protein product [Adineta ricciae]CAF1653070.1 unnamed protein product [Adineta ricciae]
MRNLHTPPAVVLYRIIGNDLPPRHSSNQTLVNVLFILENEPLFENVEKIWILNRIVNTKLEETLINLLSQYKQSYIRIAFDWNKYRRVSYYFPLNYPSNDYLRSKNFYKLTPMNKIRLIDTIYHKKNLYAMNNNGARNFALRHGKHQTYAQWLMIFDGNCYLSESAFEQIQNSLVKNGSRIKYFLVPMIRIVDNQDVFRQVKRSGSEEPQVIFRRDSDIEFLENIRYGRGPKEEILTLLGAMKSFWRPFKWEPEGRKSSVTFENNITFNPRFQYTSFVFRLYSGYHADHELLDGVRGCSRLYGIFLFLENLDLQAGRAKLLPPMSPINSINCTPWTTQEIQGIIETARERERNFNSPFETK